MISIEGVAHVDTSMPAAEHQAEYRAKYTERIGALFRTASRFSEIFSTPIVITPHKCASFDQWLEQYALQGAKAAAGR